MIDILIIDSTFGDEDYAKGKLETITFSVHAIMAENVGDGLGRFDCEGDQTSVGQRWLKWIRAFEYFAISANITVAARKKASLLHKAGMEVQEIFHSHSLTDLQAREGEDEYSRAVRVLNSKFLPRTNIPYERIKFRSLSQDIDEKMDKFEARLRRQAAFCNFGDVDENLRDQILDKVYSRELKRKLIEIGPDMTLLSVLNTARSWEDANEKEQNLMGRDMVNKVVSKTSANVGNAKCYACGYRGHLKSSPTCPAKDAKCNICKKKGHYQACCRSKKQDEESYKNENKKWVKRKANKVRQVSESDSDDYAFRVNSVGADYDQGNILVTLGGVELPVIVDSGATCNVIDEATWKSLKKKKIKCKSAQSNKRLYAYGTEVALEVIGKFYAEIQVEAGCKGDALFYVIREKGSPLLGKETAMKIGVLKVGLNINQVKTDTKIGKLKDFQVRLPVKEGAEPVYQPLRRVPVPLQKKLEEKLIELEEADIIEKVDHPSKWSSQLVLRPKKSGDLRICVDMRRANEAIGREKHHIPSFDEILPDLRYSKLFSKLDFNSAFHQLELCPESRDITTFLTHRGSYRYKRLLFGINCAPEIFQRTLEQVLQGCEGCHVYMDDVLIHGRTKEEHDDRLKTVLRTLEKKGMTLNNDKCKFGVDRVEFMGHTLSTEGISATKSKIDAVRQFREPETAEEVRSFLGLVNFVGRFIPDLSKTTDSLRKLVKQGEPFIWGPSQEKAFSALKESLMEERSLGYYDPEAKTTVIADASPVGLGAVLIQDGPAGPKVISYASKSLSECERCYSQNEKEALALVWACEHFHFYLYGRDSFDLITDNKPVETIFSPKSKPCARIERWVLRLQSYRYKIIHRPGKNNIADPLSRLLRTAQTEKSFDVGGERCLQVLVKEMVPSAMKLGDLEEEFDSDEELNSISHGLETGKWEEGCKAYHPFATELGQIGKVILRGTRLVIPKTLRLRTLELAHQGHPGMTSMKHRLRSKVWWPGIDKDCERYVRSCHGCQLVSTPDFPEPMKRTTLPSQAWQDIAMDFLGPLPSGHTFLVIIDYYSRYFEVEIMKKTTSGETIRRVKPIFARYGLPTSIRTDNGPQFASEEFRMFCAENNIEHRLTTPLWPQANGEVERQNRSLLKRLKIAQGTGDDWKEMLLDYLVQYRNTPHATTGVSPGELFFKRKLRDKLPSCEDRKNLDEEIRDRDNEQKWKGKEYADKTRKAQESKLQEGDLVLMRQPKTNKLTTNYHPVPIRVVEKNGNSVTVETPENVHYKRNSTFFKKYVPPILSPPRIYVNRSPEPETTKPESTMPGQSDGIDIREPVSSEPVTQPESQQRVQPERTKRPPRRYQD